MAPARDHPHIEIMRRPNKTFIALAIFPIVAWVGLVIALGAWRTIHGQSIMAEATGPGLVGLGVFLAIACPVLANYLRPHAVKA